MSVVEVKRDDDMFRRSHKSDAPRACLETLGSKQPEGSPEPSAAFCKGSAD